MNLTLILMLVAIKVTPEQVCALLHSKVRKQQRHYFYLVLSLRTILSWWLDNTPPLNPARDHLPFWKWASGGRRPHRFHSPHVGFCCPLRVLLHIFSHCDAHIVFSSPYDGTLMHYVPAKNSSSICCSHFKQRLCGLKLSKPCFNKCLIFAILHIERTGNDLSQPHHHIAHISTNTHKSNVCANHYTNLFSLPLTPIFDLNLQMNAQLYLYHGVLSTWSPTKRPNLCAFSPR